MGQTTKHGLRYPENTDLVKDTATYIKNLAEDTDTALTNQIIQESGTASTTNSYSSKAIDNKLSEFQKSSIMINYSRHKQTLESWVASTITSGTIKTQIGDKLTFVDNSIVIGEGVSHVRLSGKTSVMVSTGGDVSLAVHKNGSVIIESDCYEALTASLFHNLSFSNLIIEVAQGDVLTLTFTQSTASKTEFLNATYFTVEQI